MTGSFRRSRHHLCIRRVVGVRDVRYYFATPFDAGHLQERASRLAVRGALRGARLVAFAALDRADCYTVVSRDDRPYGALGNGL